MTEGTMADSARVDLLPKAEKALAKATALEGQERWLSLREADWLEQVPFGQLSHELQRILSTATCVFCGLAGAGREANCRPNKEEFRAQATLDILARLEQGMDQVEENWFARQALERGLASDPLAGDEEVRALMKEVRNLDELHYKQWRQAADKVALDYSQRHWGRTLPVPVRDRLPIVALTAVSAVARAYTKRYVTSNVVSSSSLLIGRQWQVQALDAHWQWERLCAVAEAASLTLRCPEEAPDTIPASYLTLQPWQLIAPSHPLVLKALGERPNWLKLLARSYSPAPNVWERFASGIRAWAQFGA